MSNECLPLGLKFCRPSPHHHPHDAVPTTNTRHQRDHQAHQQAPASTPPRADPEHICPKRTRESCPYYPTTDPGKCIQCQARSKCACRNNDRSPSPAQAGTYVSPVLALAKHTPNRRKHTPIYAPTRLTRLSLISIVLLSSICNNQPA